MIYCVEDDDSIRELMLYALRASGFEAEGFRDSVGLFDALSHAQPQLIMLDIMLPGMDGIEILKALRDNPATARIPVIIASARGTEYDKVVGLDLGADDYLAKPFGMMELLSRIRALLRRSSGQSRPAAQPDPELLTVGDLTLDTRQRVAIRDGKAIDLTAKEYDLVELLMKNPRRVYSRESLMDLVWGYSYAGDYRTVDVHIRRLREKLERVPAEPAYIITKWGVGYYFAGEDQPTI